MKVPAWAGRAVSSRVSSHINTYVYTQLSRVRRRHTRTGACIRNRNAATEAARTAVLAPLCRTLTVSGARINPGTWTGPTEPYVPSHPAYGSRLCDSFSTAEHHFPSRNKSGIYAFFWMGLHEVVLGVLDFFLRVFNCQLVSRCVLWWKRVWWLLFVFHGDVARDAFPSAPPTGTRDLSLMAPDGLRRCFPGSTRNIKATHLCACHQIIIIKKRSKHFMSWCFVLFSEKEPKGVKKSTRESPVYCRLALHATLIA